MKHDIEIDYLQKLCIPLMLDVLKDIFMPNEDGLSSVNTSLNVSGHQLGDFAMDVLSDKLQFDIKNFAQKDPAASNVQDKAMYVWESYKGLKAIMYYRIAHQLLDFDNNCLMPQKSLYFSSQEDEEMIQDYMRLQARRLSEIAAKETTIEINPSASIGKGFVIDHGIETKVSPENNLFSTVIGETTIIGENCTLLNSVLLGAAVINEAESNTEGISVGKRHPTLLNNVTICAGVRVLGNVTIGNNVTIGPCCVITTSVPDDYKVTIINQLQFTRPNEKKEENNIPPIIHGLTVNLEGRLCLFGNGLETCEISVIAYEYSENKMKGIVNERSDLNIEINYFEKTDKCLIFDLSGIMSSKDKEVYSLRISREKFEYIIYNPIALKEYIKLSEGGK